MKIFFIMMMVLVSSHAAATEVAKPGDSLHAYLSLDPTTGMACIFLRNDGPEAVRVSLDSLRNASSAVMLLPVVNGKPGSPLLADAAPLADPNSYRTGKTYREATDRTVDLAYGEGVSISFLVFQIGWFKTVEQALAKQPAVHVMPCPRIVLPAVLARCTVLGGAEKDGEFLDIEDAQRGAAQFRFSRRAR